MKALILNSGIGRRMGEFTKFQPKCMTEIGSGQTILGRQLTMLMQMGIKSFVITTGPFEDALRAHAEECGSGAKISFVHNPLYETTNYIYSMYLAREQMDTDCLLMHGDLIFSMGVLSRLLSFPGSAMVVSSTESKITKDFKAVVLEGKIQAVGIDYQENAVAAQPLYKLCFADWNVWMDQIVKFVESGRRNCYAEDALNQVTKACNIHPMDIDNNLCREIDTQEDWTAICEYLNSKAEMEGHCI